jgi:hypothetical protein
MTEADKVALLEAQCDRLMRERAPRLYAEMMANRRALNCEPEPVRTIKVGPPASDEAVEGMLTSLMGEVYIECRRSLSLAASAVVPGAPIEPRATAIHEAYRLARAMAMLTVALARHRGKPQKLTIEHEHRHHHTHQRLL